MTDSHEVRGFDAAGIASGIKKNADPDLALIASPVPCRAAAVFTQNRFPAAPVLHGRALLEMNPEGIHGVLINSGNANACTGTPGKANARRMAEMTEAALGAQDNALFVMSTGVIGVQLPMAPIEEGVPRLVSQLRPDGWTDAARAIMTTDTRPKLVSRRVQIDGSEVRITGIAKGAGMIHPNMATMLSVIATDAKITQPLLERALKRAVGVSFNRISIDGDTSTNDTVLLLASGQADNPEVGAEDKAYQKFVDSLSELATELAQAIVRDGEGATKFVSIHVVGATNDEEAHTVANSIATSPLVKTAFYGSDANWGRILCAAGYSGVELDPDRADLSISAADERVELVRGGLPTDYREEDAAAIFALSEFDVVLNLQSGSGRATVWTSDLSHDYVTINGDYRT